MHRRSSRHVIDVDQPEWQPPSPRPTPGRLTIRGDTQYHLAPGSLHSVDSDDQSQFVLASTTLGAEIPKSALPPLPTPYPHERNPADANDEQGVAPGSSTSTTSSSVHTGVRMEEYGGAASEQKTLPPRGQHDRKFVVKKFRKRVIKSTASAGLKSAKATASILNDFRRFVLRGNVVDLALGVIIGGAFTAIVTSVVNDLLGPLFGAALGSQLQNAFVLLKAPDAATCNVTDCKALKTPSQVYAAGGVTWNYGNFFQTIELPRRCVSLSPTTMELPTATSPRPRAVRQSSISSIDAALNSRYAAARKKPATTVPVASLDARFIHQLHKLHPNATLDVSTDGRVNFADLQTLVQSRIDALMNEDRQDLANLHDDVMKSHTNYELEEDSWTDQFNTRRTFGQKAADHVASFGGSWTFIILLLSLLLAWMLINRFSPSPWDEYPYILLNLLLSTLAALQAPIIMMSQNRQTVIDRAQGDYISRMTLRAELRMRHLDAKIDHLASRQWKRMLEIQQLHTDRIAVQMQSKGEESEDVLVIPATMNAGNGDQKANDSNNSVLHHVYSSTLGSPLASVASLPALNLTAWNTSTIRDDHLGMLLRAHYGASRPGDTLVFSRWHDEGDNYIGTLSDVCFEWRSKSDAFPALRHVQYSISFPRGMASMDDVFSGEGMLTLRNDFDMAEMSLKGRITSITVHTSQSRVHTFVNGNVPARYKPTTLPQRADHISDLFKQPLDRVVLTYRPPLAHAGVTLAQDHQTLRDVRVTVSNAVDVVEVWMASGGAGGGVVQGWTRLAAGFDPAQEDGWRRLEAVRLDGDGGSRSSARGRGDGKASPTYGNEEDEEEQATWAVPELSLQGPGAWVFWSPHPRASFSGFVDTVI
ncbi:hypothetical protein HDU87_004948 [Geranomyces variabilis]|uniref:Uncharacterized protein n=1 Tax=Geranomyces variabilis TaxID=109894 RepID=A0AAD5TJZ7_9FUNG|nr:hypothetical protein HDU87_004948 [Geranomyces variabilis]